MQALLGVLLTLALSIGAVRLMADDVSNGHAGATPRVLVSADTTGATGTSGPTGATGTSGASGPTGATGILSVSGPTGIILPAGREDAGSREDDHGENEREAHASVHAAFGLSVAGSNETREDAHESAHSSAQSQLTVTAGGENE
ncbi:hypothetical protein M1555_01895 [Patescibacteria group bacterium]|nr:hypothetical protein [Patescibacteria group bacterium]